MSSMQNDGGTGVELPIGTTSRVKKQVKSWYPLTHIFREAPQGADDGDRAGKEVEGHRVAFVAGHKSDVHLLQRLTVTVVAPLRSSSHPGAR